MHRIPSPFEAYVLTEEEQRYSRLFTPGNKAFIHNLRTEYALARLALTFDSTSPSKFLQAEAAIYGAIEVLDRILEEAESTEVNLSPVDSPL